MFGKRSHIDLKKSINKLRDYRKDPAVRAKHLKIILENVSIAESKTIFESNFSHIYITFFDLFIQAEFNLKQRVHKTHKEEFEFALWLLEKILTLLPELIHKQWQANSIKSVMRKLLNPTNTYRLRRQAVFYFLLWYQALNENTTDDIQQMFANFLINDFQLNNDLYYNNETPILVQILPSTNDKAPDNIEKTLFENFLEFILTSVLQLQWHDKYSQQLKAFYFLFQQFKRFYIPVLFPNFNLSTSIYSSDLELASVHFPENEDTFHIYRVIFIKWLTYYLHAVKKDSELHDQEHIHTSILNRRSLSFLNRDDSLLDLSHLNFDSSNEPSKNSVIKEQLITTIIRSVLYATRENINFVHEIYRQTFLLNFTNSLIIRKVITLYKDLIQGNFLEVPSYYLEPNHTIFSSNDQLKKLNNENNEFTKIGSQNVLQVFIIHSSNIFLCDTTTNLTQLIIEEQTDCCKRVLNVYRYMVMHIRMDLNTWEKLLLVLLQITSTIITEKIPKNRNQTLAGKLAPALFQTLIVTWVKASLNIFIQKKLWDRFLYVLLSLTQWEELINEWMKTMDTLTRILTRHVYQLDLSDLPLDRISEQRWKRNRHVMLNTSKKNVTKDVSSMCEKKLKKSNNGVVLNRSLSETNLNEHSTKNAEIDKEQRLKLSRAKSLNALSSISHSINKWQSIESISSPIQLDQVEHSMNSNTNTNDNRSIICGGTVRGWQLDAAIILWKRMLSALGNINRLQDPRLHGKVFETLVSLTDTLIKIQLNQGISFDNQKTPKPPDFIPPLTIIIPWCFEALKLSPSYEYGQLKALRLLCTITVHCDSNYRYYLPEFYHVLHNGLCSSNRNTIDIILKYLSPKFLSLQLPGYSLLLLDFIHACNYVLNTSDTSTNTPRLEAMSMLCSLLSLSDDVRNLIMFQPNALELNVMTCPDFKEHIIDILLKVSKKEHNLQARCVAINSLGIFIFRELRKQQPNNRIKDALIILNSTLKMKEKIILQACIGVLYLLNKCVNILRKLLPSQFYQTFSSICNTLSSLPFLLSYKNLLRNFMYCLAEWCMEIGPTVLLNESDDKPLLYKVFKAFDHLINGQIIKINAQFPDDFNPDIIIEKNNYQEPQIDFDRECHKEISLLANILSLHLVTHLGHFPITSNPARLCSLVTEQDDVTDNVLDDDSDQKCVSEFSAPNIQLLIVNEHMLGSFIELPTLDGLSSGTDLVAAERQARVLIRDLCGKSCWDALLLRNVSETVTSFVPNITFLPLKKLIKSESCPIQSYLIRQRPMNVLPDNTNSAHDLDQLNDLLRYLSYTSPEVLLNADCSLNEIDTSVSDVHLENEAIAILLNQDNALKQYLKDEENFVRTSNPNSFNEDSSEIINSNSLSSGLSYSSANNNVSMFHYCCLLITQLGLCNWNNRQKVFLMNKNDRLLREFRNLDNQCCRETHKVAVIFIESGQEDKISILSNTSGSQAYEEFLAGLAWEVELEHHTGFLGGLNKQGSTGATTPYFSTSLVEIVFHVSTRLPSDSQEAILNKIRHLGNDEVHIVWSEHDRDYRRDIIPTEFCDILIVIYPLGKRLNRVTVSTKLDIPYFGPLFDELIVENDLLPTLVRSTVIFASRAKRSTLPFYKQYFEERADAIETIVKDFKEQTTFEEFISKICSPVFPSSTSIIRTSGLYLTNLDSQSTSSTTSSGYFIEQQQQQQQIGFGSRQKLNEQQSRSDFSSVDQIDRISGNFSSSIDYSQSSSSGSQLSLRKISKAIPRLSMKFETINLSPPHSPNLQTRKK